MLVECERKIKLAVATQAGPPITESDVTVVLSAEPASSAAATPSLAQSTVAVNKTMRGTAGVVAVATVTPPAGTPVAAVKATLTPAAVSPGVAAGLTAVPGIAAVTAGGPIAVTTWASYTDCGNSVFGNEQRA